MRFKYRAFSTFYSTSANNCTFISCLLNNTFLGTWIRNFLQDMACLEWNDMESAEYIYEKLVLGGLEEEFGNLRIYIGTDEELVVFN